MQFGKAFISSPLQLTKSDRIYVNGPGSNVRKDSPVGVELVQLTQRDTSIDGKENQGLSEDEEKDGEKEEEGLTPGDLLAFAWQIAKGMVSTRII